MIAGTVVVVFWIVGGGSHCGGGCGGGGDGTYCVLGPQLFVLLSCKQNKEAESGHPLSRVE